MKIDDTEVLHSARLAMLRLDPYEVEKFRRELNSILEYMDMLSEVDTSDISPLDQTISTSGILRHDEMRKSQDREDALLNAPKKKDGYIVVPKIIE